MKVLITGYAGFIGSNLTAACVAAGHTVTGVDNFSNGHIEFLSKSTLESISDLRCDFSSAEVLQLIRDKEFDVVIHLAAVPRVSYSVEHPFETNDANVTKTLKLLEACRGNISRFVFASSSSVYGGALKLPTHESEEKNPKSPYALQKSIIEDYLTLYKTFYGLDSVSLRFFNVFGPNALGGSPYATALAAWLTAIKRDEPLRFDGDGTQSRDLCYVDNVVDACIKAATAQLPTTEAHRFNVACGTEVSNNDIILYLLKRYGGFKLNVAPTRAGDVKRTLANITNASVYLAYGVKVPVWEGIARTCDWYDENWDWARNLKLNV